MTQGPLGRMVAYSMRSHTKRYFSRCINKHCMKYVEYTIVSNAISTTKKPTKDFVFCRKCHHDFLLLYTSRSTIAHVPLGSGQRRRQVHREPLPCERTERAAPLRRPATRTRPHTCWLCFPVGLGIWNLVGRFPGLLSPDAFRAVSDHQNRFQIVPPRSHTPAKRK